MGVYGVGPLDGDAAMDYVSDVGEYCAKKIEKTFSELKLKESFSNYEIENFRAACYLLEILDTNHIYDVDFVEKHIATAIKGLSSILSSEEYISCWREEDVDFLKDSVKTQINNLINMRCEENKVNNIKAFDDYSRIEYNYSIRSEDEVQIWKIIESNSDIRSALVESVYHVINSFGQQQDLALELSYDSDGGYTLFAVVKFCGTLTDGDYCGIKKLREDWWQKQSNLLRRKLHWRVDFVNSR